MLVAVLMSVVFGAAMAALLIFAPMGADAMVSDPGLSARIAYTGSPRMVSRGRVVLTRLRSADAGLPHRVLRPAALDRMGHPRRG